MKKQKLQMFTFYQFTRHLSQNSYFFKSHCPCVIEGTSLWLVRLHNFLIPLSPPMPQVFTYMISDHLLWCNIFSNCYWELILIKQILKLFFVQFVISNCIHVLIRCSAGLEYILHPDTLMHIYISSQIILGWRDIRFHFFYLVE